MNKYELADKLNKFSENEDEYIRCEYTAMYDAEIKAEIEAEDWRKSENFFEFGHFDYEVEDEAEELLRRYGTWCRIYRHGWSGWDDAFEQEKEDKYRYELDRYFAQRDSEVSWEFWYEASVGLRKVIVGEAFDFKILDPYWYVETARGVAQETDPRIKKAYEERLAFYDGKLAQGCVYYDRLEHCYDDYDDGEWPDEYDRESDREIASTAPEYDWTDDYEYEEFAPVRNYPPVDGEFPSRRSKGKGPLGELARKYSDAWHDDLHDKPYNELYDEVFKNNVVEAERVWSSRWQAAHDYYDSRPHSLHARGKKRAGTLRDHRNGVSARPASVGADYEVWLEYEPETDSELKNRRLPSRKPGWKNRQGLGLSRSQLWRVLRLHRSIGRYKPKVTVYDHPWAGPRTWHTGAIRHQETKQLFPADERMQYKVPAEYTMTHCRTCGVEMGRSYVPIYALAKWGDKATKIVWCVPCDNRARAISLYGNKGGSPHHKSRNNF